jgi:hypothetical protein
MTRPGPRLSGPSGVWTVRLGVTLSSPVVVVAMLLGSFSGANLTVFRTEDDFQTLPRASKSPPWRDTERHPVEIRLAPLHNYGTSDVASGLQDKVS